MFWREGQRRGDIDLAAYLATAAGPVPLVLDLRIAHDRWGSSSDPQTIIIVPLILSPLCLSLLVRLVVYITNLYSFYFYRLIGKLITFLQLQEFNLHNLRWLVCSTFDTGRGVEIPIDSGIGLSITIDKLRVFINKTLSTESLINQLLIKRVGLSISIDSR